MIGSGIFIVSADIARTVGAPGWLLAVWAATGLLTVIAALSYGELASAFPGAGGQYVFLREAYGSLAAFLFGWASFLVIQCGTIAAVAVAFAKFLGVLVPAVSDERTLVRAAGLRLHAQHAAAIASLLALTWVNAFGVTAGKRVQNAFTSAKFLILAGVAAAGFLWARNPEAVRLNLEGFWDAAALSAGAAVPLSGWALAAAFGAAMVGSLFSSDAWNNVTFASDEMVRPRRDVPLALFLGTAAVCVLYLAVNVSYLQALPLRGAADGAGAFERGIAFARGDRVGTAAMHGLFGDRAAAVMAALIVVSTFGCNNGIILASARLYWAMARDGLFFRGAGRLNRHAAPARGLWIQALWASVLVLSGTYGALLDYVVFTVLVFYILTLAAIPVLRRKRPDLPRPVRAFGYPVLQILYVAAVCFVLAALLAVKPGTTWPGLILVALGVPVYFAWRRHSRRSVA
jgi:APA family basic amino acid/polyamine antiporter